MSHYHVDAVFSQFPWLDRHFRAMRSHLSNALVSRIDCEKLGNLSENKQFGEYYTTYPVYLFDKNGNLLGQVGAKEVVPPENIVYIPARDDPPGSIIDAVRGWWKRRTHGALFFDETIAEAIVREGYHTSYVVIFWSGDAIAVCKLPKGMSAEQAVSDYHETMRREKEERRRVTAQEVAKSISELDA